MVSNPSGREGGVHPQNLTQKTVFYLVWVKTCCTLPLILACKNKIQHGSFFVKFDPKTRSYKVPQNDEEMTT